MSLWYNYGVRTIYGIKWGYAGIYDEKCWKELKPEVVVNIHEQGGTILGTSRGGFDGPKIADALESKGIKNRHVSR
jgi:6-phosphofructokinase 1